MTSLTSSSSSDNELLLTRVSRKRKFYEETSIESELLVLLNVRKNYTKTFDYRTYLLANKSTECNETASSQIAKMVKRAKSQVEVHFFDPENYIFIIRFRDTFMLACDTQRIHEGKAMWLLTNYVNETLGNEPIVIFVPQRSPLLPLSQSKRLTTDPANFCDRTQK